MTKRAEGVEGMPSDCKELLVRSRIADLRREAERERLANLVDHKRRDPEVRRAGSIRGWLRTGLTHVVGAVLRRPSTNEGSVRLQSGSSQP